MMKALKIVISIGLVFSSIMPFILLLMPGSLGYRDTDIEVILNCSLPEAPKQMPVLEVLRYEYTIDEALNIAADLFNITGNVEVIYRPRPTGDMAIEITDGKKSLTLFFEGAVEYTTPEWGSPAHIPSKLPSPSRAREIANAFLNKVRSFGLIPDGIEPVYQEVRPGERSVMNETSWTNYLDVVYKITYKGYLIIGPSSEITVSIGDRGRIVAFFGDWRRLSVAERLVDIITPEEALNQLKAQLRSRSPIRRAARISKVIIDEVEIAYWAEPVLEEQDELLPAYNFKGVMIFNDGKTWEFNLLAISAVSGEMLP